MLTILYFYKSSWALFWSTVKLLGNSFILSDFALWVVDWIWSCAQSRAIRSPLRRQAFWELYPMSCEWQVSTLWLVEMGTAAGSLWGLGAAILSQAVFSHVFLEEYSTEPSKGNLCRLLSFSLCVALSSLVLYWFYLLPSPWTLSPISSTQENTFQAIMKGTVNQIKLLHKWKNEQRTLKWLL